MLDRRQVQVRTLVVGLVVLIAGLVAASDVLHGKTEELLAATETVISRFPVLGALLFVILAMASAMLFFFSSAILFPFGVNAWGAVTTLLLLWLGWLLGGIASYLVGRFLGRSVTVRLVGEARVRSLEARLRGHARFVHILFLQLTLPSEIPGYVLGTLRYPFRPYVGALAIAEVPYALGTAYLGVSFLERKAGPLLLIGICGLALAAIAYLVQKKTGASA